MTRPAVLPPFTRDHLRYWRGQVGPRLAAAFLNRRSAAALVLAAMSTVAISHAPSRRLEIQDLASAGLSYAALSFGACITGAVLVLTLPSRQQIAFWAQSKVRESAKHSNLSDLLFIFTFSAILQLAVAVVCGLAFLLGGDLPLWPSSPLLTHVALLLLALIIVFYSFAQLLVVVYTISQIGAVLIMGLNSGKD